MKRFFEIKLNSRLHFNQKRLLSISKIKSTNSWKPVRSKILLKTKFWKTIKSFNHWKFSDQIPWRILSNPMKFKIKVDVSLKTLSRFRQRYFKIPILAVKSVGFFFFLFPIKKNIIVPNAITKTTQIQGCFFLYKLPGSPVRIIWDQKAGSLFTGLFLMKSILAFCNARDFEYPASRYL